MKAIQFPAKGEVEYVTLPDPRPGHGEIVVEVKASGVCHTDFEVLKANYGNQAFPVVPGHEYAGVVADVGTGVSKVSVGDKIVVDPNTECGECPSCRRGWGNLCENLGAYGVTMNGGFSELSLVREDRAHPLGSSSFTMAALAEPMGCVLNGLGAVYKPEYQNVLIFGAGPMGILIAIALQIRGVNSIMLADIDESRLELADSVGFGAIVSGDAGLDKLRNGVDLVVDATGAPAVAGKLVDYMANGGSGLFFGVCPSDARIEVSPFEIFRRQLTLAGSHSLNHNIPEALDVIEDYGSRIEQIVSHRMTLEEISKVFRTKPPKGSLKIQALFE